MSLLNNQQQAFDKLLEFKVGALFMDAGAGKTRVALELVNSVKDIDLVVWIAPLKTITTGNVINEVSKWGGFNSEVCYYGIESIQASDRIYLELRDRIEKAKNPFLICDESIKIKNFDAKRTKRLLDFSNLCEYKLILNGTPLSKNLLDLWSQMEFLSPKILNMQLVEFKNTFCNYTIVTKRLGGHKQYTKEYITGYENIDYLYSLIHHYIYECDLNLEVKQSYRSINYSLDEQSMVEYQYLKEKYLDDEMLQWKNNNIFLEMTQKMQHSYCCTQEKFDILDDLFLEIDQSKTIIFCKYILSQEECKKRFPKALVLSYQKDALGLNLQDYNNTIYFDKVWDYYLRTQSSRRTWRTGQELDCRYFDLTGNVGLEMLINRNIHKKIGMVEYFKGKTKNELKKVL